MTKARPDKGQPRQLRSARARRLNRNGLWLLAVAVVVGAFTGLFAWGAAGAEAGGLAGSVLAALLALVALFGTLACVALVVARRFERTDVAAARLALRQAVSVAYREAAPRVPVGLPQPVGSGISGDGT